MMLLPSIFLISFAVSLLLALVLILTRRFHGHLTEDNQPGVQKLHKAPTPRVGGVALLPGALAGATLFAPEAWMLCWMLALASLPAFMFGLIEDVTKRVGVRTRLLATICSGLIFCVVSGYHLDRLGLPGLDLLFSVTPFAVLFTAFAMGGVANAINLIDGVNGLASGSSIIILSGFAVLAAQSGDSTMLMICLSFAGALGGIFAMNFPMGRIFLGDAGAYTTGFVLAAVAVVLPARNPEISPLVGLLGLSYPVIETLVSIRRRIAREGTNPGQPDRLHLHSLIYRSRARSLANRLGSPELRNALSALLVMGLPCPCPARGCAPCPGAGGGRDRARDRGVLAQLRAGGCFRASRAQPARRGRGMRWRAWIAAHDPLADRAGTGDCRRASGGTAPRHDCAWPPRA